MSIEFMTDEELVAIPTGSVFVFDVECYVNFFYIAFKCLSNGKFVTFERSPACDFQELKLRWLLWRFTIVGFNSKTYDIPMIELAAKGFSCEELKNASDFIIKSGINYGNKKITPFDIEKKYKIKISKYNHIDLIEVAPLEGSLKLYAGRLHCKRMQDLPFHESHTLTESEANVVRLYCCNDLDNTELLFNELAPELKLRAEMSEQYGVDLRSKSDAQIAEAVINSELQKVLGFYPTRPTLKDDYFITYNLPSFISFKSPILTDIAAKITASKFELDGLGSPMWPDGLGEIEKVKDGKKKSVLKVTIGNSTYKLGMGGLHSMEKSAAHFATDEIIIADNDVESFYPRIILNQKLFPEHLGEAFLQVFGSIVDTRIRAKHKTSIAKKNGNKQDLKHYKTIADSLKITINGSFGKFGNKYSTLYAPQLMLQVTITGQLVLLMLIEMLEEAGIDVISGNTDGIISKYHKDRHTEVRAIITEWEKKTNFKTEETRYCAVYSRDVNSYVAVKTENGDPEARFLDERLGVKTKGAYCERGSALNSTLSKNPETLICSDAVISFLKNGTPLEKTIRECKDIRRFLSVSNVRGGGQKNGVYLGKVVRWYYPKNETGCISYVGSGNKVAKTDACRPIMDLPDQFPTDIDYDWYIKEAVEMLYDCGRLVEAETALLPF